MESNITPNTQYQQVTVDVPEDRVAEFHAFFARFLAGPSGRPGGRRRHGHGRHGHHGHHGHGCGGRRESVEQQREPSTEATEI